MKTTLLLTALTAFLIFTGQSSAEVITKGGASALLPPPNTSTDRNAAAMNCAKCKSDFFVAEIRAPKGSRPENVIIEKHRCEGCDTRIETRGGGKAKTDVAVHACKTCGSKSCCS